MRLCSAALRYALCVVLTVGFVPASSFAYADECATSVESKSIESEVGEVSPEAASVVEEYFQAREDQVACEDDASAAVEDQLSPAVAEENTQRADTLEAMADDAGIQVKDVQSTVDVTSVSETAEGVQVEAYEEVTFTYDDLADGVGGTDVAKFGTSHMLTVNTEDGQAVITADEYDESDLTGICTNEDAQALSAQSDCAEASTTAATAASGTMSALSTTSSPNYCTSYNQMAVIAYADKYWDDYNSAYKNYNSVGGDCANFVSQCIYAGGMPQVKGDTSSADAWWYNGKGSIGASSSWIYCPTFVKFFSQHGNYIMNPKASQIFPGSPVVYKKSGTFYHATICVGYNSAGTPVISAHNNNRYHVPYTYANNDCCTIQLTATATGGLSFQTGTDATYSAQTGTTASNGVQLTDSAAQNVYTWQLTSTTEVELSKYTGSASYVRVPTFVYYTDEAGTTTKLKVSSIGKKAFRNNQTLTRVFIPATIKEIGADCFNNCRLLTTVKGCKGVKVMNSDVFYDCRTLVDVPAFPKLQSIGSGVFHNCYALKSFTIPDTVTTIKSKAFYNCKALKTLVVGKKVKSIGKRAFYNCSALKKLTLKTSKLKKSNVGLGAFKKLPAKVKVKCGSNVKAYKKWLYKRGLLLSARVVK